MALQDRCTGHATGGARAKFLSASLREPRSAPYFNASRDSSRSRVPEQEMRAVPAFLCATLALAACDSGYIPYVPGEGFSQTIQVSVELPDSGAVRAGEWVTLHAVREAGPWVLADSTTEDPACERISPIAREDEAAHKVEWVVEPREGITFSTPAPPLFERQIQFSRPGRYTIAAASNGCGAPFTSNRIEVEVR
jgi:hypothetical protein